MVTLGPSTTDQDVSDQEAEDDDGLVVDTRAGYHDNLQYSDVDEDDADIAADTSGWQSDEALSSAHEDDEMAIDDDMLEIDLNEDTDADLIKKRSKESNTKRPAVSSIENQRSHGGNNKKHDSKKRRLDFEDGSLEDIALSLLSSTH